MLLREAIDIPEHVSASDFVLILDRGVEEAGRTVSQYVVTDKLAEAFDAGLDSYASALTSGGDRGSFVHGSFGSGKSHFMAILHLLISGDSTARALPGLQRVIAEHEQALGANVLCLDYHLIGAQSFEEALFSGYLRQVAARHPDAALPVLHNIDALFANADGLRQKMGDAAFFEGLNTGAASAWGSFGGGWTPETYDAAVTATAVNDPEDARGRLATALVGSYFQAYTQAGDWVGIEEGLKRITAHAKSLGYEALVLFLDELVLWLASHLADSEFVSTEGSKVAKLVETGAGSRAIPIVSFVARQRDLKDFLGDSVPGAERVAVGQTFTWWEDRFNTIKLQASDLPEIANRRLLQPSSSAGAQALTDALAAVKANARAWDDLLRDEQGADESAFAKVYPFSPALVDTLVALSGLLQRERTALKVMAQLLVNGRDIWKVTDVIPVGDLYDVMVEGGDQPLTDEMRTHFNIARELYRNKLRPMLLATHQLTEDDLVGSKAGSLAPGAPASVEAFFTDDRLAKTLLVAALAPGAPALRNLTASRLAYLNYGTVPAFVPGTESVTVIGKVKAWADQVGEIQVGDGTDPLISISISGVDYDSVLNQVREEDNLANRRRLLRRMVFEQLGVPITDSLLQENPQTIVWRGSKRTVDLVFGNVRDPNALPDDVLRASGSNWKLVVDYPFDDAGHGPHDDIARIEQLRASGLTSRTVAWIPMFLSASRQDDLGTLVLLDFLLAGTGDNFDRHAAHLPSDHRQLAKSALTNRRNNLRDSLGAVIRQAYGMATANPRDLDTTYGDIQSFATLDPSLTLQPPVGASLKDALIGLTDQMLSSQFPSHPRFDPSDAEVKRAELNTVVEFVTRAMASGGRVEPVDNAKRGPLRRVANPLQVGEMLENHYIFGAASFPWRNRFTTWAAGEGITEIPVARARQWLAEYGMAREVENLLLLAWALLDDKQWTKAGANVTISGVEGVSDDLILREPTLPDEQLWITAVPRAASLLGVTVSHLRSAANLAALASGVRSRARELQAGAADLTTELAAHGARLGLDQDSPRMRNAALGKELLGRLANENDDVVLVQILADADVPQEAQSLAKSMTSATTVAGLLRTVQWPIIDALGQITADDPRFARAREVLDGLSNAARADELHAPLSPALNAATRDAGAILAQRAADPGPGPTPDPAPPTPPLPVPPTPDTASPLPAQHVDDVSLPDIDEVFSRAIAEARAALQEHPGRRLKLSWWLE